MTTRFLALGLALTLSSSVAIGQGILIFSNFGWGANAPVYDYDGVTKLGTGFQADLYWAPGIVADSDALTALGQPANFAGSGYFLGGLRSIVGQPGGAIITGQVRVWQTSHGSSWEQVRGTIGGLTGESDLFQIQLGSDTNTSNTLTGLKSFQVWPNILTVLTISAPLLRRATPSYFRGPCFQARTEYNKALIFLRTIG